jgi:hypothetical protein
MESSQWENWYHLFCRKVSFWTATRRQFTGVGQGMKQTYLYLWYPLFQTQWEKYKIVEICNCQHYISSTITSLWYAVYWLIRTTVSNMYEWSLDWLWPQAISLVVGTIDRMVVEFTTTYAISAYHHWWCEFQSRSARGVQRYVIKIVSDLRQSGGFSPVSSNKTDRHNITEILLKVALNIIKQTNL